MKKLLAFSFLFLATMVHGDLDVQPTKSDEERQAHFNDLKAELKDVIEATKLAQEAQKDVQDLIATGRYRSEGFAMIEYCSKLGHVIDWLREDIAKNTENNDHNKKELEHIEKLSNYLKCR